MRRLPAVPAAASVHLATGFTGGVAALPAVRGSTTLAFPGTWTSNDPHPTSYRPNRTTCTSG